jgi:hypothetical protein
VALSIALDSPHSLKLITDSFRAPEATMATAACRQASRGTRGTVGATCAPVFS